MNGHLPRLGFRRAADNPLRVEYAMVYYPGCFTLTGLTEAYFAEVRQWCKDNNCGKLEEFMGNIDFETEEQVSWFMLRWQ